MGRQRGYPCVNPCMMEMPVAVKPNLHMITAIHVYELMVIKMVIERGCRITLPKWFWGANEPRFNHRPRRGYELLSRLRASCHNLPIGK
jgi:hypothetical protein